MKLYLALFLALIAINIHAQSVDDYTRYELLDPSTSSFRILYEVSANKPGSVYFHNTLRKGSEHRVDQVLDLATGKPLLWKIVQADEAAKNGLSSPDKETDYLQINLAYPIPVNAEYRLLIDKTYKDQQSYYADNNKIIFERSLGIKRNAIVLPVGYEVIYCNYPAQVAQEPDGRIKLSFINRGTTAVPLRIEGRKLLKPVKLPIKRKEEDFPIGRGVEKTKARTGFTFHERAHQTREIVYFLQQPETNSFRLYHDYTETREGTNKYLNVVRAGSKASNPSAFNLDNGNPLKVETLKGNAIKEKGIDAGTAITPDLEVIVIWFDAVKKGESTRIRIEETYTDPNRYLVSDDELIWDRAFGRVHNTVVLPKGWYLTHNAEPATISLTDEGLSLYYVNDGPDEIDVFIKGFRN